MSLPLDLLPHILGLLEDPDLQSCTLVTGAFYHTARQLLSAHLTICYETWDTRSPLLLGESRTELRQYIRMITLKIIRKSSANNDSDIPTSLQLFLQEIGPQLNAFCIQSLRERGWHKLHPVLRNIITTAMPRICSLKFNAVTQIPLLTTLSHFPLLDSLSVKAMEHIIGTREDDVDPEALPSLPKVSSISIEGWIDSDFGDWTSLAKYMLALRSDIKSLTLLSCCNDEFPLDWRFLEPFTSSLHHLSLSIHLYQTIAKRSVEQGITYHGSGNFYMFPQLRSVTFFIPDDATSQEWQSWSIWVARSMKNDRDDLALPFLQRLIFILRSGLVPSTDSSTSLDKVAVQSTFEVHMIIRCSATDDFSGSVNAFRTCLPSWDAAGRLKFWMRG